MHSRIARASLLYLLVLQMLHLPLPCPDLDGECRGTPILSLADTNAWHPLLMGVRPNADIDRGPSMRGLSALVLASGDSEKWDRLPACHRIQGLPQACPADRWIFR